MVILNPGKLAMKINHHNVAWVFWRTKLELPKTSSFVGYSISRTWQKTLHKACVSRHLKLEVGFRLRAFSSWGLAPLWGSRDHLFLPTRQGFSSPRLTSNSYGHWRPCTPNPPAPQVLVLQMYTTRPRLCCAWLEVQSTEHGRQALYKQSYSLSLRSAF